jgi:hypothetical protein
VPEIPGTVRDPVLDQRTQALRRRNSVQGSHFGVKRRDAVKCLMAAYALAKMLGYLSRSIGIQDSVEELR